MRILLIEDELAIANFIREGLEEESYTVDVAYDGKKGLSLFDSNEDSYDLVLLDWMLPGLSGIEVCRAIRNGKNAVPIIFLTAKDQTDDAVFALDTGANDYIRKPFAFEELLARIRVWLRQGSKGADNLAAGSIVMDLGAHRVLKGTQSIELTQKEFALLEYLLRHKGKICRRTRLLESIWDIQFEHSSGIIDVYINALRKKLDDPRSANSFITTIRGVGYRVD